MYRGGIHENGRRVYRLLRERGKAGLVSGLLVGCQWIVVEMISDLFDREDRFNPWELTTDH